MTEQCRAPPRQRRHNRHVSFGHLDNEPDDIPHRRYPPTPTQLPPTLYEEKYPHWEKYLTIFLALTCIVVGLRADYVFATDDQTPVVCYFHSWSGLDKCPSRTEVVGEHLDGTNEGDFSVLPFTDKDSNTRSGEGVFETGLRYADYVQELGSYTEQLNKVRGFLEDYLTFGDVAMDFDIMQNKKISIESAYHFRQRAASLHFALETKIELHTWLMKYLIRHSIVWSAGKKDSFQLIVDRGKLKPARVEKLVRAGLVDTAWTSIMTLRQDADKVLSNTKDMLILVEELKGYYNVLAHPTGGSLKTDQLESLKDAKYWWKQLKPHFKRESDVNTKALASYFLGLVKTGEILEAMKKSEEELCAVLGAFEQGVKGKSSLSAKSKISREVLEGWLPTLARMTASLEDVQSKLEAVVD